MGDIVSIVQLHFAHVFISIKVHTCELIFQMLMCRHSMLSVINGIMIRRAKLCPIYRDYILSGLFNSFMIADAVAVGNCLLHVVTT